MLKEKQMQAETKGRMWSRQKCFLNWAQSFDQNSIPVCVCQKKNVIARIREAINMNDVVICPKEHVIWKVNRKKVKNVQQSVGN